MRCTPSGRSILPLLRVSLDSEHYKYFIWTRSGFSPLRDPRGFYLRQSQQVNKWPNLRFLLLVVEKFLISGQ